MFKPTTDLFYEYVLTQSECLLPRELLWLIEKLGSAKEVFDAEPLLLKQVGVTPTRYKIFEALKSQLSAYEKSFLSLESKNIHILRYSDPTYPIALKNIVASPYLVFYKGEWPDFDNQKMLAVVGTRKVSEYGISVVKKLVPALAQAGLGIVSGMAFGVDALAHRESLRYKAQSVAVLARGVDRATPSSHESLYEALCDNGCVMSEFAFAKNVHARDFPRRNRLVSGLSLGVLVIEAPVKSGACITAHCALEQNRNVYAVPASIYHQNSWGSLKLIQAGAKLVYEANDILCDLGFSSFKTQKAQMPLLNGFAKEVLTFCALKPRYKEELYIQFSENASELSSTLTELELMGCLNLVNAQFTFSESLAP